MEKRVKAVPQEEKEIKKQPKTLDDVRKKLDNAGFRTPESIAVCSPDELTKIAHISIGEAEQLLEKIRGELSIIPKTAEELYDEERKRGKITTNSVELDTMLNGGIWTKEITEFAGSYSAGKTQLCFQLSITTQLPLEDGGLEGEVFFLDTEGTFSPQRVAEMAVGQGLEPRKFLKGITVARAFDSNHQMDIVRKFITMMEKEEKKYKLLIIDSFATHFRSDYTGKNRLMARQQNIMQHASTLANIAQMFDMAVVVTNQVMASIDDLAAGATQPALGLAWAHRPQTRLFLRKSRGSGRIARLFDSPRYPEKEVVFYVTEGGISDKPYSEDEW